MSDSTEQNSQLADDFKKGDSLSLSEVALATVKSCMLWWMGTVYNDARKCTYIGEKIAHGNQLKGGGTDSFSCGIIACNAIAHEIFGDELWTYQNRRKLRTEAFNAIVLHHNERVSPTRYIRNDFTHQ